MLIFILISAFTSLSSIAGTNLIEFGIGTGQVESKTVLSQHLQYSYTPETKIISILGGDIGYALGFRSTKYTADLFQGSDNKEEFLEDIDIQSHNIFGQIHYSYQNFQLGFNIDLIGITNSSSAKIEGSSEKIDNETSNIFLWAKNDKGTLNSQFFLAYKLEQLYLRGGLSHTLITHKDTGLSDGQDRQKFFDLAFISIGYLF